MKYFFHTIRYALLVAILLNNFLYAQTNTIFVSPNGNELNDGKNPDRSLLSINNAIEKAQAGDTVFIMPGKYIELIRIKNKKGLPEKPICIIGNSTAKGEKPIIDGGAEKPSLDAAYLWIDFENSSWIEIKNLNFENGWTDPVQVYNSSYLTFDNCNFKGGRRVIYATGVNTHHILIENCYWDQGGQYLWTLKEDNEGVDAWTSMHHESLSYFNGSIIDFRKTGGSIVIRNNKFINTFNSVRWRGEEGYDSNVEIYNNEITQVRDNDFEPETYTYNLHIYHNFSHNVHRNLSVDNVSGGYIYYYGNVISTDDLPWTQEICRIFWKIYGSQRNLDYPLYLFNNSFYGCATAFKFDVGDGIRMKHFNNAYYFLLHGGWLFNKWESTNEFDYDVSNENWAINLSGNNQEEHGKIADINYVDPANNNFKLKKSSPGIDAGKVITFPEFEWNQSYDGNAPDVGAYENGKLVEGPPFRFKLPPDSKVEYKEKPRIVRHQIDNNKLTLYFSDKIDIEDSKDCNLEVFGNGEELKIISSKYLNNYQLEIVTCSNLDKQDLSISFDKMPVGMNGESATNWASTIRIKK